MPWLDIALVTVTIGTAAIIISPLARLMGMYARTDLVESGFVLGMYGRPTWRFWALFVLFFAVHAAANFDDGHWATGAAWAAMTPVYLVLLLQAARQKEPEADEGEDAESASTEGETE